MRGSTNAMTVDVDNVQSKLEITSGSGTYYAWYKYGKIVFMTVYYSNTTAGSFVVTSNAPRNKGQNISVNSHDGNANQAGRIYLDYNSTSIVAVCNIANAQNISSFTYLSE